MGNFHCVRKNENLFIELQQYRLHNVTTISWYYPIDLVFMFIFLTNNNGACSRISLIDIPKYYIMLKDIKRPALIPVLSLAVILI